MGEWIALVSGKDGVGKTTAAAYLGLQLSALGKTVLVSDLGGSDLSLCYHYSGTVPYHYLDVLEGNCRVSDALDRIGEGTLYALNAPKNRRIPKEYGKKTALLFRTLAVKFDFVLTELPSGAESDALSKEADRRIVVATPSALSVAETVRYLSGNLEKRDALLLNRIPLPLVRSEQLPALEELAGRIGLPMLGAVIEDPEVYLLPEGSELPGKRNSPGEKAFYRIARRLLGEDLPVIVRGR